jgi:hypothetical protein
MNDLDELLIYLTTLPAIQTRTNMDLQPADRQFVLGGSVYHIMLFLRVRPLAIRTLETLCSRTSADCWTILCVKGFLSFSLVAATHVPPDVSASKLYEDSMFGNSIWHCVYEMYGLVR